jgi:hypothetical protein
VRINVDIRDSMREFSIPKQSADIILENVIEEVRRVIFNNWVSEAKNGLHATREGYLNGLLLGDSGKFTKSIILTGQLNLMIEQGANAFDMKEGFSRSPNIKYGKDRINSKGVVTKSGGWFLTIPFRHGTPGIVGENQAFSGIMPDLVYAIAKKNNGKPIRANQLSSPYSDKRTRATINQPTPLPSIPEYRHKHSIYEGIKRQSASYRNLAKGKYGKYVSFRRAGQNSDPLSWWHKGFQARNFHRTAITNSNVEVVMDNALDKMISSMGFA